MSLAFWRCDCFTTKYFYSRALHFAHRCWRGALKMDAGGSDRAKERERKRDSLYTYLQTFYFCYCLLYCTFYTYLYFIFYFPTLVKLSWVLHYLSVLCLRVWILYLFLYHIVAPRLNVCFTPTESCIILCFCLHLGAGETLFFPLFTVLHCSYANGW